MRRLQQQSAGPFFESGNGSPPLPWDQVAVEIHRQLDGRMPKLLAVTYWMDFAA